MSHEHTNGLDGKIAVDTDEEADLLKKAGIDPWQPAAEIWQDYRKRKRAGYIQDDNSTPQERAAARAEKRAEKRAKREATPKEYNGDITLPNNAHAADLSSTLSRDRNTLNVELIGAPAIDIDSNIGLMLLMGISNNITIRKEEQTEDYPNYKPGDEVKDSVLADAIWRAQNHKDKAGNPDPQSCMMVVLRFPNTSKRNRYFDKAQGGDNKGAWVEMPVIIDISDNGVKKWRAHELGYNEEQHGAQQANIKARECGFANARDMQNSRPLALNNYWLKHNDGRADEKGKYLAQRQQEKRHLEKEIASTAKQCEELRAKLAEPLPSATVLQESAELLDMAKQEIQQRREERRALDEKLAEERTKLRAILHSHDMPSEQRTMASRGISSRIRDLTKERRTINRKHGGAQEIISEVRENTPEFIDQKRQEWQSTIELKQERVMRLTELLEQCDKQIEELSSAKIAERNYAPTDRNPTLLTINVLAADPRSVNALIMDKNHKNLPGRTRVINAMYREVYDRAMDHRPNGWLSDALSRYPEGYYTKASARTFDHLRNQTNAAGASYPSMESFALDETSMLGKAIHKLHEDAKSNEQRAAERKSAGRG